MKEWKGDDIAIELTRAEEHDEALLANLLSLYIHDLSEFIDLEPQPDGRFDYPWLRLYWSDENRMPFIVNVDDALAGFVFVTRGDSVLGPHETWDVTEFFILRGLRRRGLGEAVAHEVWLRFQGPWEVRVRESNAPAIAFWTRAVSAFTDSPARSGLVEKGAKRWQVFSFTSPGR